MIAYYNNEVLCVEGGILVDEGILTRNQYVDFIRRKKMNRLKLGGNGRSSLIEYKSIPFQFKRAIIDYLGYDPEQMEKHPFFRKHLVVDREAVSFFSNYQTQDGNPIPIERQKEYHANAMFLNALNTVKNKVTGRRKTMGGRVAGIFDNLSEVVNDLRDEYNHSLPANPVRLREKLKQYLEDGYPSLIHRGYGNNNSRKVDQKLERLILSIYVMNNKPYPNMVRDIYLEFLANKIDIIDAESGEVFDREDFFNEKGVPVVVSEATIWNYVNNPKNRAIVDSKRNDSQYFNGIHRPHHHRHAPLYSLSKISLDDRDLIGKVMVGGHKQTVKAYYAYDVTSRALIGVSYSYKKDKQLFIDCLRNLFGFLKRNGLGFPLEPEVEHHIVKEFKDDLMKAGNVFPHVRWCAAGNSQEKRAEHMIKQKKYGFEKRYLDGIGRWNLSEANRPKQDKVWDDGGMHIKEKIYDFEELVANDRLMIEKYNYSLHPDQKKFKGMTRMQVFLSNVNPDVVTFQEHIVAQYISTPVKTSVRRNQYVRVKGADYQLPNPEIIARLGVNDYDVDAYYLDNEDGSINQVHIFQNGQFIATCKKINRYNESAAEQTDLDRQYITEQSKYVAGFDSMIRKGRDIKTTKVVLAPKEKVEIHVEIHETSYEEITGNDNSYLDEIDYVAKALNDL